MRTIVVSGSHSGIGKTQLAAEFLAALPQWSALKITTVKRENVCPRESRCGACDTLKEDFDLITDERIISRQGSDTARLRRAGAKKVAWLKSTVHGLRQGFRKAVLSLEGSEGIVIEGTSVVKYFKPDLAIFLKDGPGAVRNAARAAHQKADIIIDVTR